MDSRGQKDSCKLVKSLVRSFLMPFHAIWNVDNGVLTPNMYCSAPNKLFDASSFDAHSLLFSCFVQDSDSTSGTEITI